MRKVKRNLVLFFSILTLVAVLFTACPHPDLKPTYKTLTLSIQGKTDQNLYYDNGAWYKTLTDGKVSDKVEGDASFDVATTWTVKFVPEVPEGVAEDQKAEFKVEPVDTSVAPGALTFDVANIVDATGKSYSCLNRQRYDS